MTGTPTHSSSPPALAPGLYITATPIGNARDITLRALEALQAADLVLCEDTRVTSKLLAIHSIKAKLAAYHDHNAAEMRPKILEKLAKGEAIVLVSDAGTPLVSDPGFKLVRAAIAQGATVTVLPGASSVLAALCVSGLPTDRFFFGGFLPPREAARKAELEALGAVPGTLIFLESASRLAATLNDMVSVWGRRPAAVARELTKKFEQVQRGTLADLAEQYAMEGPPKGEIVILVAPPDESAAISSETLDQALLSAIEDSASLKDAVALVAETFNLPRKQVYARALVLKKENR